jgi:hypothetical protein
MNIPKNHHYVSQCQIKRFFSPTEKRIYLYDKTFDNFYDRKSSKSVFSEKYSNTKLTNGKLDHESLETELRINFEDHFEKIHSDVETLITHGEEITDSQIESLHLITLYGLIGEMRSPFYKKQADDTLMSAFRQIYKHSDKNLTASIKELFDNSQKTNYSNVLSYTETAIGFLQRMRPLNFTLFKINSTDTFLLPDTSAFHIRAKINQYFNPDIMEVALVGIPLTDKIFIQAES